MGLQARPAGAVCASGDLTIELHNVHDGRDVWGQVKREVNRKLEAQGYPLAFPAVSA